MLGEKIILSYKYPLYPNKTQENNLLRTLEGCRCIYNVSVTPVVK